MGKRKIFSFLFLFFFIIIVFYQQNLQLLPLIIDHYKESEAENRKTLIPLIQEGRREMETKRVREVKRVTERVRVKIIN